MKSHKISPTINIVCDKCGKEFEIKESDLKIKKFENEIEIQYFKCPDCGEKYIYLVTDESLRGLITIYKLGDGALSKAQQNHIKREHEKLKEQYACLIDDLG